ncbi:MAG TPA: GAF domain-containing protein [Pyrinomonadaceae bacterium]|nr:GAF domain-containing protein [Pyrinomonadaceae bacterium]
MSEQETEFAELFGHISDPAIVIDRDGACVHACNEAFATLAVQSCASVVGMEVSSLLSFEDGAAAPVDSEAGEFERATVLVNGEHPLRVRVERIDCHWNGQQATLCLFKQPDGRNAGADHPDSAVVTSDEMSALFDYLREATEQLEVVNRVVAAVNSSRTIEEVFGLASEQMHALIPFDRASIALCEEDGETLRVFALSGAEAGSLAVGATAPMRGSVTELALRQREMVVIPELEEETRFNVYDDLQQEGFRSAACCPLFSNRRAIGSLNLTSKTPAAYGRKHMLALERLAPPLAIAIEKVLLLQQAERRSQELESTARREELAARIGRKLSGSLDPSAVLQETVDALGAALEADRCHVTLLDGDEDYALVGYEYLARREVSSLRGHRIPLRSSAYAQKIIAAQQPTAHNNIKEIEQDELVKLYVRLDVCAVLAAPVSVHGMHRGLLELHMNCDPREWTEDDAKLLGAVAAQVSVALTNARLYEASRRRSQELEGLYKISRAFSTLTNTSEIYGRLTSAIAELVGGEKCLLATYDRRQATVRAEAPGYNTPPEMIRDYHFTLNPDGASEYVYRTGETEYIYRTGEPFFSNDPGRDERFNQDFIARYQVRSALIVPLLIKRELIGFIYVANRPGGFRQRDVQLLEIFATQVAETIAYARLFVTIQAQAEREAVVNRLVLALQQATEPRRGVEIVVERVGQVLGLDRCVASLFAENEQSDIYGEWCAGGVSRIGDDPEILERSPVQQWLKDHRQPLVVTNVREHKLAVGVEDLIEKTGLQSLAVVPIMHQGRVIGSLSGHQTRRQRRWAEDDIDLLTAVATQIGSTLENARLISELREASRLKDEFLATLSHELRTPLTAIKGWVDLLSENDALQFDDELADGIEVIRNSASSLTQLISDLLDLSRIQRRVLRLERKASDVNLVILDAVQVVRPSAVARRQEVRLELDDHLPVAQVDPHRIQQVVWNLLNNAVKFTPEGGRVIVRSRLIDSTGIMLTDDETEPVRWIVIEVEDNGDGIPPEFLPYVWDRFRQADGSSTRRHGGLGIGLALVKELVEAHGGQVTARSEGGGATFTVRLPMTATEAVSGD